ncbi:MAG: methyltransferase domain-containing protein [Pseudonocardiaceae bacterium]
MTTDPAGLRRQMVDAVTADEQLTRWRAALTPWLPTLHTVPRHLFIPNTVWVDNDADTDPVLVPLHREQDPERWLSLAYDTNEGLATQVDDGQSGPGLPTSSASGPVIVAVMLAALDAEEGHQVLEIGTGTGYNAALLAHRLGADRVTSVEVDPDVAARARKALADAGYGGVRVATGDGAGGYPPRAPYDRVVATAACHQIPYPWVAQTRPGGRVLLPWADTYSGGLVALTVAGNGIASGGIVAEASFMALRDQRDRGAVRPEIADPAQDHGTQTTVTTLHPHEITGPHGARLAVGRRVPGCRWHYWPWEEHDPVGVLWLVDPWGSWAKLTHDTPDADQDEFPVQQHGPRRLWDEVVAAHQLWVDHGRPGADRWRFTVTPDGQRIELK